MKGTAVTALAESRGDSSWRGEGRLINHPVHTNEMTKCRDPLGFALAFALETDEETWQRVCLIYGLPLNTAMPLTDPFAP